MDWRVCEQIRLHCRLCYALVSFWKERSLLERYGSAACEAFLDLDCEH